VSIVSAHFRSLLTSATKSRCRQSLAIAAINYSGRASELGGIVNLFDRQRSSLSHPAFLELRSTIDTPWRNFLSPGFRKTLQREVLLFCRCQNFFKTQWWKKASMPKTRLIRSFLIEHRQTDRHRTKRTRRHLLETTQTMVSVRVRVRVESYMTTVWGYDWDYYGWGSGDTIGV